MNCLRFTLFLSWLIISGVGQAKTSFSPVELRDVGGETVTLSLYGVAKREVFFFDVYDIANYLPREGGSFDRIEQSPYPRLVKILYKRDLGIERVRKVLAESFEQNASKQAWPGLKSELSAFLSIMTQDIEEGDVLELLWLSENQLRITAKNGSRISTQTPLFIQTFWSIWFGESSVVDRDDLFKFRNLVK